MNVSRQKAYKGLWWLQGPSVTTEELVLIPGPQGCSSEVTPGRNLRAWVVLAWPASHCAGDRVRVL